MHTNGHDRDFDDAQLEPLWARIDRDRLPVFEHPMFPKQLQGFEGFELPLRLGFVFDNTERYDEAIPVLRKAVALGL